jgi:CyaY protein
MTESEFLERAEACLAAIESALEDSAVDCDLERHGPVLDVEFADGSKIVINSQTPMRQLWVAARSGGFHYAWDGTAWRDTRDGSELFVALSRIVSAQGGHAVVLSDRT